MRWVVRLVIVVLSVHCASAQLPDTLRLAPCRLASLEGRVIVTTGTRWAGRGWDRIVDDEISRLDSIGEMIAPEPLDDFADFVMETVDSIHDYERFERRLCLRYPAFDCDYDFDVERMVQAIAIGRAIHTRSARSLIVMAPLADSPGDSIALFLTLGGPGKAYVETLRILDKPLPSTAGAGEGHRVAVTVREAFAPWHGSSDSMTIATGMKGAPTGALTVHRLPLQSELRRAFTDRRTEPLTEALQKAWFDHYPEGCFGAHRGPHIGGDPIFRLLDRFDADTTFTYGQATSILRSFICSHHSSYGCEYDTGFSDTARWNGAVAATRTLLSDYLALPDRVYAVVEEKGIRALILFPAVTSRRSPIILTPEEMNAHPLMEGIDWHDRLMRSLRDEECWAERMDGF